MKHISDEQDAPIDVDASGVFGSGNSADSSL